MKLQSLLKTASLSCTLIISAIAMPATAAENTETPTATSQSIPKQIPTLEIKKPQSGPQAINGGLNRDIIRRRY